jgi:hypothetical protein
VSSKPKRFHCRFSLSMNSVNLKLRREFQLLIDGSRSLKRTERYSGRVLINDGATGLVLKRKLDRVNIIRGMETTDGVCIADR